MTLHGMISQKVSYLHGITGWVQKCRKRKKEEASLQTSKKRRWKRLVRARDKQEQLNKMLVCTHYLFIL